MKTIKIRQKMFHSPYNQSYLSFFFFISSKTNDINALTYTHQGTSVSE